jgi:hypothetical protein
MDDNSRVYVLQQCLIRVCSTLKQRDDAESMQLVALISQALRVVDRDHGLIVARAVLWEYDEQYAKSCPSNE